MKLIPTRRAQGPRNRAEAWACFTANLALPGSGSLAAGKAIGYFQLALYVPGFLLSVISGIHLISWMMNNWTRINQQSGDPVENLALMWRQIRWPLVGVAICFSAILWGAITGWQLLAEHPKNPIPPRIV
jgi:hypothetical protein